MNNLPEEDKEDDSVPVEVLILRNLQKKLKIALLFCRALSLLKLCVSGEMESLGCSGSIQLNVGREKENSLQPNFMEFSSVSQSSWTSISFTDELDTHPGTSEFSCGPALNIDLNLEHVQVSLIVLCLYYGTLKESLLRYLKFFTTFHFYYLTYFTIMLVHKNLHKCLSIWPWKLIHCLLWCRRIHSQELYCLKFSESSNLT